MATVANVDQIYPSPLKHHIDVAMNSDTFFETLLNFHSSMGTRLTIPVIGGEKLDLHQLYFLVTQRGSIEKTVLDGKWRDVVAELNVPRRITNRSFVLKKHYMNLLFHYEQVYFFRRQGPIVAPSAILLPRRSRGQLVADLNPNINQVGGQEASPIEASSSPTNREAVDNERNMLTGGQLEHSNHATERNNSQTLILGTPDHLQSLPVTNLPGLSLSAPTTSIAHPKPCRSAYNIFFEEKYSSFRNLSRQSTGEFVRLIEESWDKLTEVEKEIYNDQEMMEQERYRRELQDYRQGMRVMQSRESARANAVERENSN